jgi:hypothetical protein
MKRKLMACVFAVAMLVALSVPVMADPIEVGDKVMFSKVPANLTSGGPFNVIKQGSPEILFATFCLELNEYIGDYWVTIDSISNNAVMGGLGGGPSDPLSDQTAWLYYQYRSGMAFDLDALQVAIWKLEDEGMAYWADFGILAENYIGLADAAVAGGWENDGKIAVINPVSIYQDGTIILRQSMLTLVPEPMSLILLGFGLLGLGITRKLKK